MPPERTFTQAELNAYLAKDRKKHEAELSVLRKDIAERDVVLEAARARVSELEGAVAGAVSERDSVRADFDVATASHGDALAALEQQHAEFVGAHRRTLAERAMSQALLTARMVPSAESVAVAEMMRSAQIEQDAAGKIVAVTYGAQRYANPLDAAKAFISAHPFFECAPTGGSGALRATSPVTFVQADITKQDPMKLADEGWATPPR